VVEERNPVFTTFSFGAPLFSPFPFIEAQMKSVIQTQVAVPSYLHSSPYQNPNFTLSNHLLYIFFLSVSLSTIISVVLS